METEDNRKVNIRRMEEKDLVEVLRIEEETFSDPWTMKDFSDSFHNQNNTYLVAEVDGKLAGYCGYWGIAGEGYIYNVAVAKEFRRQRIGYTMLRALLDEAKEKGIEAITLEVRRSNLPAIRLYESLGFQDVGIRKDFYSKPTEDAVIMWLRPIQ